MAVDFSHSTQAVLRILSAKRNVLISGPPGTGKSRLLSELALAFEQTPLPTQPGVSPVHEPGSAIPIPAIPSRPPDNILRSILPGPDRTNRRVFRTAFHQGSKYRDFVTGVVPVVKTAANPEATGFRIIEGTLFRAAEHAKKADGASLLIIDEINRGPAIQIFGGSIVAIESDKRLAPDGSRKTETLFFEVLDPSTGDQIEYALPHHLYIVAAMNQADASVEPLDVAFLRRWVPFTLEPDIALLRHYFGRSGASSDVPDVPANDGDVYEAAIQALQAVNKRISVGRGAEFQIGHGVLMNAGELPPVGLDSALFSVAQSWKIIRAHIDEVFFGDTLGIATTLNVGASAAHPYKLIDSMFANEPRVELLGPSDIGPEQCYALLRAIAK